MRVAVTGAGQGGVFRHKEMEAALAENWSADAIADIKTSADGLNGDIHASPEYRAHLIGVMASARSPRRADHIMLPTRRGMLLGGSVLAFPHLAQAQVEWPQRPIRMVIPYPPGGASDIIARLLAPHLAKSLGQTLVVENRPGANGFIAASWRPAARRMATRC